MKLSKAQAWGPFQNGDASHNVYPTPTPTPAPTLHYPTLPNLTLPNPSEAPIRKRPGSVSRSVPQDYDVVCRYRGTSLTRNRRPLEPYRRPTPRALWWS